ncbi:hypothetical protein [Roseovarius nubinhibens]|uniref:hypothetical protein n=1 Tax=Roseovarius nubinhibens TaxID=314263 RepID=UPI0030ECC96D|tara:strand:- start:4402 stop:4746 length:345 start_codon:yes stop_codon:yes gene_type:complete
MFGKSLAIAVGAPLILAVNFSLSHHLETPQKNDFSFLHANCPAINATDYDNLEKHIISDRSMDGTLYIFNHISDRNSPGDFEAGFRSIASEILCMPGLGCAIPPRLSDECRGAF